MTVLSEQKQVQFFSCATTSSLSYVFQLRTLMVYFRWDHLIGALTSEILIGTGYICQPTKSGF